MEELALRRSGTGEDVVEGGQHDTVGTNLLGCALDDPATRGDALPSEFWTCESIFSTQTPESCFTTLRQGGTRSHIRQRCHRSESAIVQSLTTMTKGRK